jgi:mannitol 2-dehydrogenase
MQDALRDELMARARRQRDDPLAFIGNETLFGALARNPGFAESYRSTLESLHRVGTRRTIQDLNASLAADNALALRSSAGVDPAPRTHSE